jgi:hypothetical protein
MNIGSGIQKLMGAGDTHTTTGWRSHKPVFIFFQNKESTLKILVLNL